MEIRSDTIERLAESFKVTATLIDGIRSEFTKVTDEARRERHALDVTLARHMEASRQVHALLTEMIHLVSGTSNPNSVLSRLYKLETKFTELDDLSEVPDKLMEAKNSLDSRVSSLERGLVENKERALETLRSKQAYLLVLITAISTVLAGGFNALFEYFFK